MTFKTKTAAIFSSILMLVLYIFPFAHKLFLWLPYSVEEQISCALYLYLSVFFGVDLFYQIKPWKYIFMIPAAAGFIILYQRGIYWGMFPCAGLFVAPVLSDLLLLLMKSCNFSDVPENEKEARQIKWTRVFLHIIEIIIICFTCYQNINYLQ